MKAFHFRLDQALRWRETQVSLQKTRVAAMASRVAGIEASLQTLNLSILAAGNTIAAEASGGELKVFAAWTQSATQQLRDLDVKLVATRREMAVEVKRLVEADQKQRLLQNLKQTHQTRWHRDFDRELAAFADEMFLNRHT